VNKSDKPSDYAFGDTRREVPLQEIEDQGPLHCYSCGAHRGEPHSPLCRILKRGNVNWAQEAESKSDMIEHEYRMVSRPGERGWRKAHD
jgi:hypothetical protein